MLVSRDGLQDTDLWLVRGKGGDPLYRERHPVSYLDTLEVEFLHNAEG